jgi:HEPN domain-containing protein
MNARFDSDKLIKNWIVSSDKDFKAMIDLYRTRHYNWALFNGHLVIEKAGIEVDNDMRTILDSISRFNINARYDDFSNNKSNYYPWRKN